MKNTLTMTLLMAAGFAGAATLEIETGNSYHCAVRPATNLVARIEPADDVLAEWSGEIVFSDYFGRTFKVPVAGWGAKGTPLKVKLPEPPGMGCWRGTVTLASKRGGKLEAKGAFAVLDPHPVTPLKPRGSFRLGINYHVTRYWPDIRRKTMDALVGIGAKMMRGDLAAICLVETKEDEYHWEETDAIVADLLAHGIAIDAIIATVPGWARHPDYMSLTNGPTWVVPMREGLAEKYGRALAQRYGTKIEYYEIGNELDLVPAKYLTVEQAMARQREFYRGIKSACPAAQVIPSGWAFANSDPWMVSQKGFQERFMTEAQDVCDFHPVHIHASYDKFRGEMLKFFAWRREKGVTIPWYANETAASTCSGQENSCTMWVWQKPLWSWAHGSSDYIWYNLRCVGPDPENGEHAYGMFTMDMQPKPTAAAFSALTAVFNELAFEKILRDTASCQLYRFRGRDSIVLVGWDSFVTSPREIPVTTDATSVESVDIMGNRKKVESVKLKVEGSGLQPSTFNLQLGKFPMAYVFRGATKAEPNAAALGVESSRKLEELFVEPAEKRPEAPQLVLDSGTRYTGFCDGNALTEHRLWKGPQDLSAKIWLWKPQWGPVTCRVEVTDDRPVPFKDGTHAGAASTAKGDHIRVVFNGKETSYAPAPQSTTNNQQPSTLITEFELPWHAIPGPLTLEIYDDDGEGLDGFLGGDGYLLKYR